MATGRPDRGIYLNLNRETQPTAVSDVTERYIVNNINKHERFDQFWKLVEQLDMGVEGYSGQTIYAFNKLTELSFKKGKPHNALLIAGIRAMLTILKYVEIPKTDVTSVTYQIGILLKKSRLLMTEHMD